METSNTFVENASVYKLLSMLCKRTAQNYCHQSKVSVKQIASQMRSQSYEIILNKISSIEVPICSSDPIVDLLSCYFVLQQRVTNVAEYKRCVDLKKAISNIRNLNLESDNDYVYSVIRLIVNLQNTVSDDICSELHQRPFSFGLLEKMLPKPEKGLFGSPQPYSLYPPYVFHLPFNLKSKDNYLNGRKESFMEYTVETFDSSSLVPDGNTRKSSEAKSFQSPIVLSSKTSTQVSPYSECDIYNLPRLSTPRDLRIPKEIYVEPKISLVTTAEVSDVNAKPKEYNELNIWELASQVDKNIPGNIWEIVSKLPAIHERQIIATSSREMRLWRQNFGSITDYDIISERQFIRHITYLLIGIETESFPLNKKTNSFRLKDHLVLECISCELLVGYVAPLLIIGTYYRRLYEFAFINSMDFHDKGLLFEAVRETVRQYLLKFRLEVTEIFEKFSNSTDDVNCMPSLLQILHRVEPLKYEIQTVASIHKLDSLVAMPYGAELMPYLFNEISLVTHKRTAETLYNSLFIVCRVYFKFIEKFIFEGELNDQFNEFFIRKDSQYVNSRSKRYWDKGFHITLSLAVPDFLRPLASYILLCGKSVRLLKLCNPTDPLILISTDHPFVRCCSTFEELEREQQLLDVYRTRCLFVSGEPVTFDQILLKREAERKAFTEMASVKQAETMEKIIAERKRLAQLIIAEKQHSLRVLEAAMAEAKAAKNRVKQRDKHCLQLEEVVEKVADAVDSKLRDDEKTKMLEYYSKLNMEVEKSKIHTEWKIKRLQLDQTRMQLLSTEERNLKREKLELEHQKNEEIMAMSIQSDFKSEEGLDNESKMMESTSSLGSETNPESEFNINKTKSQASNDVFNAICSVNKNVCECDNKLELDAQGNIINDYQNNKTTSSDVIGGNLNNAFDNQRFLEAKKEALNNKIKVMAHEFGDENNLYPIITLTSIDEENNISTPFTEARRNKIKVLGEYAEQKDKIFEPVTAAQKEAVINKKRVLSAEFGKSDQKVKEPFIPRNEAQREAVINKQKVLGAEFEKCDPIEMKNQSEPRNEAQREAVLNRQKVLGAEFEKCDPIAREHFSEPRNEAQREAIFNKQKILGAEFGNFDPIQYFDAKKIRESKTDAQNEALINKQKVMGVEYNLPLEKMADREPANIAQIEALRNRSNVMGSEHYGSKSQCNLKKSGLKLNLRPYGDSGSSNTGAVTPGELFQGLDLETPTTAEMPGDGPMTSDIFTPRSESKELEKMPEKDYLRSEFDFSIIVDEAPSVVSDQISPMKVNDEKTSSNILNGLYSLENFDPFGVKISKKFDNRVENSYSDPAKIFAEMKKTPYRNIYKSQIDQNEWIVCDNIATLTACLQRSVMLPLHYQLEVVNNSILTHFLVNLDMYEHLRSLKDYFFLMDGEFSRSICNNLFAKLTKTLNPQELLNFSTLHNILDEALGSSISHVHKFSENLSFSIPDIPLSFQHSSPDVLQCLSLTYSVTWPLNIIISQEALIRYAKVFQFLIKMRRIFWVLSQDFETLKLSVKLAPHSRKLLRSPEYISLQLYRHIMASLIRALDNYIVTTCILTSWTEFEKDLKKARTLDDLYDCHVVYVKNVLFRCLLNNRSTPVMKLLNDIFTVILKFSRVLKAGEWQQKEENGQFTHTNFAQLEELYHLYEKLTKYLHKVITKLMECGYQRHLVELLTMVNLNGYYDAEKHENN